MTFIFAQGKREGDSVEYGILDSEWVKPVLVFGASTTVDRFSELVSLKNSLWKESEGVVIEHIDAREVSPEFFSRVEGMVSRGSRVLLVCTTTDGATREQIDQLFVHTGVRIFFRVTQYQMLWLRDYLPPKMLIFPLVTLAPLECVIDYSAVRASPEDVASGVLFSALPLSGKEAPFVSMSAEALRNMLSVFDHEIS